MTLHKPVLYMFRSTRCVCATEALFIAVKLKIVSSSTQLHYTTYCIVHTHTHHTPPPGNKGRYGRQEEAYMYRSQSFQQASVYMYHHMYTTARSEAVC